MTETERVDAFIRAKQDEVLGKAIATVETAAPDELAAQVHRLVGTLGTFGLTDAATSLQPLNQALKAGADPNSPEAVALREAAANDLRQLAAARQEDS